MALAKDVVARNSKNIYTQHSALRVYYWQFYSVKYEYCPNPTAKVPIMLLNKHIGVNAKGETGIMGDIWSREVLALKNAGKEAIEVWVNSSGGNVYEGWSIYGSLKNSGLHVTTVNMGCANSTAGWIFQAGDKRVWMNYAMAQIHTVQGEGDAETIARANDSIATMLSNKGGKTKDEVLEIMQKDTLIGTEAAKGWFFDELGNHKADVSFLSNSSDENAIITFGNQTINDLLNNKKMDNSVNALLGLHNEASIEAQTKAIQGLVNAKETAEKQLTDKVTELTNVSTLLKTAMDENATLKAEKATAESESKEASINAFINESVTSGLIANNPDTITAWTNAAKTSGIEVVKSLIGTTGVTKQSPKIVTDLRNEGLEGMAFTMAQVMMEKDAKQSKLNKH